MALPASGNLSLKAIQLELLNTMTGNASLETLSLQANKTASHAMSEFYGFNGAALFSLSLTHASSTNSGGTMQYYRSVQVVASNLLDRTCTVSLRRFVSVWRHSNGSTAGSVFSDARLSNASFNHIIRAQLPGGNVGFDTESQNNDLSWDSDTYAIFSLYHMHPNPKPVSMITYSSVSIVSVFGQIKTSLPGGSTYTIGPF